MTCVDDIMKSIQRDEQIISAVPDGGELIPPAPGWFDILSYEWDALGSPYGEARGPKADRVRDMIDRRNEAIRKNNARLEAKAMKK